MAISIEAIVGIIAAILTTIPIAISVYSLWNGEQDAVLLAAVRKAISYLHGAHENTMMQTGQGSPIK
ncbi:hypothetical protein BDW66DRAFT_142427 [Aspergillus desertorum]